MAHDARFWYLLSMNREPASLTESEVELAHERRLVAMHLQEIERNPFDGEDIAMFEMFERERWPHEKRLAHILERAAASRFASAAE